MATFSKTCTGPPSTMKAGPNQLDRLKLAVDCPAPAHDGKLGQKQQPAPVLMLDRCGFVPS